MDERGFVLLEKRDLSCIGCPTFAFHNCIKKKERKNSTVLKQQKEFHSCIIIITEAINMAKIIPYRKFHKQIYPVCLNKMDLCHVLWDFRHSGIKTGTVTNQGK